MGSYEAMNEVMEWSYSIDPDQTALRISLIWVYTACSSLNEQILRENIR